MDELDALLGDLGKGLGGAAPSHATTGSRISTAGGRGHPAAVQPRTANAPAPVAAGGRGRPASGLEDLDSLITQLGGGGGGVPSAAGATAGAAQRKPAPAAAPVANAAQHGAYSRPKSDVDDIDALMASLSLPAAGGGGGGGGGAAGRAAGPAPARSGGGGGGGSGGGGDGLLNDLDAIMASLGEPTGGSAPSARSSTAYPAGGGGGAARPGSVASPAGSRVSAALGAPGGRQSQDLDALLNSLQVDSRAVPVAHHQQQPAPAAHHQHHHAPAAGGAGMPGMRAPGSGGSAPMMGAPAAATPKGTCATCQRPIQGPMMQALGGTYHPNCFVCGNCGESLGSGSFFQTDGRPTCSRCYQAQFCARCAHCSQAIQGQCISALNKQWHVNCFICAQCLKPFGTAPYFEREGNPFCESCLYGIFSSRCGACDQPIKADTVNACGKQYHPECFVCAHCRRAFAGQPYFEYGGRPYCQLHYHSQIGATCGCGCGRSIMGRVVQALGKQWLPEHFLCGFCMNSLAGQNFTQRDNKAYCNGCFGKLFAA